jgi:nucleotide-binding universal stress UspA family protein
MNPDYLEALYLLGYNDDKWLMKGLAALYNKILVPTDGSKGSLGAIELARDLLGGGVGKSVSLVHVASIAKEIVNHSIINTKHVDEELIKSRLMQNGHKILDQGKIIFDQAALPVDTMVVLYDDPGDKIVKLAQEQHFDLIVMGSRGLSAVKEILLGSVSSKVLHHASCPVIIYRG